MPSGHSLLAVELLRIGAIAFLYSLSIFGWGNLLCDPFPALKNSFGEFVVVRLVTGCGALYAAFILLSAGGALRPAPVAVVLSAGLVLAIAKARPFADKFRQGLHQMLDWPRDYKALFALACSLVALQIACGFTPLIFYDSQVYHLLAPAQFLKAGSLIHIPWNVLSNGPSALQLTFGISWIADPTGNVFKLLMTVFGCLSVLAAAKIGGELGFRPAIIAAVFVLAYPEFWIQQTLGAVDLPVGSFLIFGTIWWVRALRMQNRIWAVLAGVALGFVVASRYQGIVLVVWTLTAVFVAESVRNRKVSRRWLLNSVIVLGIVSVMASPWFLRNYFSLGNPVFPLMQGTFQGPEWSPEQAVRLQDEVMGTPLLRLGPAQMVIGPVGALLMTPSNGLFGLGLLLGSLIALWASASDVRLYAALGIGGLIIWGLIHPTPGVQLLRFNAASLVLMLTCTGAILGSDRFRELKGSHVAATLALGSFVVAIVALHGIVPVWKTLTSATARTEFWRANVPSWRVFEFANGNLDPARHKILLIGETRALWLRIPFLAPSSFNGPELAGVFPSNVDANEWLRRLHDMGVTHILICNSEWQRLAGAYGYFRLSDDHLSRFNAWLHTLSLLFDDHQGNVLLKIPVS